MSNTYHWATDDSVRLALLSEVHDRLSSETLGSAYRHSRKRYPIISYRMVWSKMKTRLAPASFFNNSSTSL